MRREAGRLERDLRAERPEPRSELVLSLSKHVAASGPRRRRSASRLAFSLALLTLVVGTFASFGGVGYAAQGAVSAVEVISGSSAQQQYGPAEQPGAEEAGAAAGAGDVATAGSLPFTGISLAVTAALGLALLSAGLILRRAERRVESRRN
jgi:hypothetical protein